jgi:hypothetical protein
VPTLSVTNSIAFANLRDPAADFGAVRMGGTVGWVLVSWPFVFLLGAHATAEQVRWIFLVAAIVSFVFAGYALTLPHTPARKDAPGIDNLAWRRAFKLLAAPFVLVLFLVTFIDSVIHNGYFVMADAFLTNRVGIAGNLSMVVLSLGQVAEILTMFLLGRVLARLGWKITMIVGVLGHAARFAVFAFFADSIPVIVAVQLLHGICYAFFFATVYIFVDAVFPKDVRSSAQGLFNLLILGSAMWSPASCSRAGQPPERRRRRGRLHQPVHGPDRHGAGRRAAAGPVLPSALAWPGRRGRCGRTHRGGQPGPSLSSPEQGKPRAQRHACEPESLVPNTFLGAAFSPPARPSGATLAGGASAAETPFFQRHKLPVGIQLYSLGPDLQKELDAQLATVAKIGFKSVELAGYLGRTPAELRAAFDKAGLVCPSAHISPKGASGFSGDLAKLADDLHVIGVKSAIMPILYIPDRLGGAICARPASQMTADDWKWNADFLNEKAAVLKKAGIVSGYHNHNFEFAPLKERRQRHGDPAEGHGSQPGHLRDGCRLGHGRRPRSVRPAEGASASLHPDARQGHQGDDQGQFRAEAGPDRGRRRHDRLEKAAARRLRRRRPGLLLRAGAAVRPQRLESAKISYDYLAKVVA